MGWLWHLFPSVREWKKPLYYSFFAFTPERGWKALQSSVSKVRFPLGFGWEELSQVCVFSCWSRNRSWCAGHLVGMLALDPRSIPATALLRKPKENLLNLQLQDKQLCSLTVTYSSQDQVSYKLKLRYFRPRMWPLMLPKQGLLWRKEMVLHLGVCSLLFVQGN